MLHAFAVAEGIIGLALTCEPANPNRGLREIVRFHN
jgi:hypothetical protein